MEQRAKDLITSGDQLYEKRPGLLSHWQDTAENFYPPRADFTASQSFGGDMAGSLTTSYPLLAHRELSDAFSAMLRPRGQDWFHVRLSREDREDNAAKRWLEWATGLQKRAMYDPVAQFVRASKEGDRDFAAFGQCVKSVELNRTADAMLYRCWHLRDVAWCETYDGRVGTVHRKWKPTARHLAAEFRGKLSPKVVEKLDKDPYCEFQCRHIVIPSDEYDSPSSKADYESIKPGVRKWKTPYVSVYLDVDNEHIMEEVGVYNPIYVIPRWMTLPGSQYAYSPAVVAALPDARLIQAMTLTLLEAGEKAVNPPMITPADVLRSDIQIFAGGLTTYDAEYDEKTGQVLRPIPMDTSGIPLGMEMRQDVKEMIAKAFFLDKIGLPQPMGKEMTAFEVGQRIQEYIRNALPLFEPMETEDNTEICSRTFDVLLRAGAFGSADDMPPSLRGQEVQFRFESPLHEAIEKQKGQVFMQAKGMLAEAVALDPGVAAIVDIRTTIRDVLNGIGTPSKWLRDEEQMDQIDMAQKERQQAQEMLTMMGQGATVAKTVGEAGTALKEMQA